jgi:hypothetical protein
MLLDTDDYNSELRGIRSRRWEKVFGISNTIIDEKSKCLVGTTTPGNDISSSLFTTLCLEVIIQLSKSFHMMQNTKVYKKWSNCILLGESCAAHPATMASGIIDSTASWHDEELSYFDNSLIPLISRLAMLDVCSATYCSHLIENANINCLELKAKGLNMTTT